MAKNDVTRVSTPDTTEGMKRRNAEHEKGNRVHRREVRQAAKAGSSDYKSRYLARTRYEQAIVKNLKPMLGPNGDNETASQFLNGAVERRAKLFGVDVSGANAPTASELLTRAMNYVPPAPVQKPGKKEPGFIDKLKEVPGVIKDLAEVMSDGAKKSVTLDPTKMSSLSGASDVVQQAKNLGIDSEGVGTVVTTTEGTKFVDANTGKARNLTDADRRDIRDYKSQIGADRIETKVIDPFGVRQAAKGGDGGNETSQVEAPVQGTAAQVPAGGPRIVINPSTFRNGKDALCVAFNERFRIWMEERGFNPTSEPTDAQRKFFRDTAYADDEVQLRRTILARIATLDTSVSDPTDDQMTETLEMLEAFKGTEEPENDWERNALDRLINLVRSVKPSRQAAAPKSGPANATAGETDENPVAQETPAEPVPEQAFEYDASGNPIAGSEPVVEQAVEVTPEELAADKTASEGAAAEVAPVAPAEPAAEAPAAPAAPAEAPAAPAQPAAPAAEATEEKKFGIGTQSGVWTGGKEGEGRELTGAEAQFAANREANAKPVVSYGGNDTQGNPLVGGQKDEGAAAELVPKNPQAAADANAAPIAPPAPAKPAEDDKKGKKKKK